MKKLSLILLAGLVLISSCSKNNDLQDPMLEDWVNDLSLPVPIRFSGTSTSLTKANTKAAVVGTGENKSLPQGLKVGIFAVDEAACDFKGTGELLNNLPASADANGILQFDDGVQYYPYFSEYDYSFYGYYPYDADVDTYRTPENGYHFRINIDGKTDILFAETDALPFEYEEGKFVGGYNASYVRKVTAAISDAAEEDKAGLQAYLPELKFNHLLTQLSFSVKASEESLDSVDNLETEDIDETQQLANVRVTEISIESANSAVFTILGGSTGKANGNMTPGAVSKIALYDATREDQPDGNVLDVIATKAASPVGNMFVLPAESFKVTVTVAGVGNQSSFASTTFTIKPNKDGHTEFMAGYKYNLTVIVNEYEAIDIKTSVADFIEFDGTIDVENGENNQNGGGDMGLE